MLHNKLVSDTERQKRRSFFEAISKEDVQTVEMFIQDKAFDITDVNYAHSPENALQVACRCGCVEIVDKLLKTQQFNVDEGGRNEAPLMLAIRFGHVALVRYLLNEANCDPNVRYNEGSVLELAIMSEEKNAGEMVDLLLLAPRIKLIYSEVLPKSGGRGKYQTYYRNALMFSVRHNQYHAVEKILKHPTIDIDAKDPDNGYTALHYAKEARIVNLLLQNGADPNVKSGYHRQTPLLKQLSFNDRDVNYNNIIFSLLASKRLDVNIADDCGNTPLFYSQDNWLLVKRLLQVPELSKNHQNAKGFTALHGAALEINSAVRLLLKALDANIQDNDGNTPLHLIDQTIEDSYKKYHYALSDKAYKSYIKKHLPAFIKHTKDLSIKNNKGLHCLQHSLKHGEIALKIKELLFKKFCNRIFIALHSFPQPLKIMPELLEHTLGFIVHTAAKYCLLTEILPASKISELVKHLRDFYEEPKCNYKRSYKKFKNYLTEKYQTYFMQALAEKSRDLLSQAFAIQDFLINATSDFSYQLGKVETISDCLRKIGSLIYVDIFSGHLAHYLREIESQLFLMPFLRLSEGVKWNLFRTISLFLKYPHCVNSEDMQKTLQILKYSNLLNDKIIWGKNYESTSILHIAIVRNPPLAELFVDYLDNIEILNKKNQTPLNAAIQLGQHALFLKLLAHKADLYFFDGINALQVAVDNNRWEMVPVLLEHDISLLEHPPTTHKSWVHYAVAQNKLALFGLLPHPYIQDCINVTDDKNKTPLQISIATTNDAAAARLLAAGSDVRLLNKSERQILLKLMVCKDQFESVKFLLSCNIKPPFTIKQLCLKKGGQMAALFSPAISTYSQSRFFSFNSDSHLTAGYCHVMKM